MRSRKLFSLLGLAFALSSGAAAAADLPTRKEAPIPVVAPIFNWSGFYFGGYGGVSFGRSSIQNLTTPGANNLGVENSTALTAGVLAGYNFQVNSFVGGAEAEFGYNGINSSGLWLNGAGATRSYDLTGGYIGRLRLRAGFAANTWLFYAAGGLSLADEQLQLGNPTTGFSQSINNGLVGFNVGAGTEYAINQHLLLRLEYIFDDFGTKNYNFFTGGNTFDSRSIKFTDNTVRAGLEYKF